MAKYTELLGEYLQDHDLPAKFSDIEGLSELFIAKYCDKELGYETENIFTIKLEAYANLYIPQYKAQIENVQEALQKLISNERVTESEVNTGKRKNKTTDLPLDATDVEPTQVAEQDESKDTTKVTETGANVNDAISKYETLIKTREAILLKLVNKFSNLFMKVY